MTQSEILKATDRFFTKQPFWDITRKRTDTYLRIEDETVRIIRYGMNEGTEGLDCIPGVGQIGIMFSVQEKRSKSIPLRGASRRRRSCRSMGSKKVHSCSSHRRVSQN